MSTIMPPGWVKGDVVSFALSVPSWMSAAAFQEIQSEIYRLLETGASFEEAKAALMPLVAAHHPVHPAAS